MNILTSREVLAAKVLGRIVAWALIILMIGGWIMVWDYLIPTRCSL